MDPFSITASVVGITTTCLATIRTPNDLGHRLQGAALTIAAICSESAVISATLSRLQSIIASHDQSFFSRFDDRMESLATFDIALLGCMAMFSCLQEEVQALSKGLSEDGTIGRLSRPKLNWKEETMQELLRQLQGQQVAMSLLLQILQTSTVPEFGPC